MVTLDDLGWSSRFDAAFDSHRAAGLVPARVSLEHTHIYRVLTPEGERLARISGRLRHHAMERADFPVVGDWVAIDPPSPSADARIRAVLPRFSRFSRRASGDVTEEQVIAANIDVVFLVSGLDGDFNPRRIERYLLTAWDTGASPVIVLNKTDLVDDPQAFVEEVEVAAQGVPVVAVSARRPETMGVLRNRLGRGRTGALLGSSGVGKSSIVNALIGEELLRTRDVRIADSRGRHTSTSRQMILLPEGGILIDTPGLREIQLWDTGEGLAGAFADIEALAESCRFRDCRHDTEPGCAVTEAVADGRLDAGRLESYRKLQLEQQFRVRQQDVHAQLEQKRRFKILTKAANRHIREKREGPA
ncbi:MAG TPA: ribosome small subunit-dependent GTPase A [Vicinamibacterales bacterium]|jgi:ribosome biogenesis GTPase